MAPMRKSRSLSAQRSPSSLSRIRLDPSFSPRRNSSGRTAFSAGAVIPVQSLKSVLLSDWWLRRERGKGLAVTGFETKGGSGVRLFSSAAISKRHDSTTLQTVDGITISLVGLLDRSRTLQNGFSSEVCNNFLLGFPYSWQDYATPSSSQEESITAGSGNASFEDIPVNRFSDLLMSPLKNSKDCLKRKILEEVVDRLRHCTSQDTPGNEQSDRKCGNSGDDINSGEEAGTDNSKTVVTRLGVRTRGMLGRKIPSLGQ